MKSNNEEYLDSLLDSAQKSNSSNPQSALSRMAAHSSGLAASGSVTNGSSGDIGALVTNSNGNKDLKEIGDILDRLDRDELIDSGMTGLLNAIERPADPDVPKFTIGNTPSSLDVRDPEEIALDEAIADAERMDAEIQSGKLEDVKPPEPLVEEDDDALLEMAPEVALPEDNDIPVEKETDSDMSQTPEEILTDLLDDMPGENLAAPEESSPQDALLEALDSIHEDESESESEPQAADETEYADEQDSGLSREAQELQEFQGYEEADVLSEPEPQSAPEIPEMPEDTPQDFQEESQIPEPVSEQNNSITEDDFNIDDLSLEDLEAEMDEVINEGNEDNSHSEESAPTVNESMEDSISLDDLTIPDMNAVADENSNVAAAESQESVSDLGEAAGMEAPNSSESTPDLGSLSEDEFNLDALEASLDNLLGDTASDSSSTDGEVAEFAGDDDAGSSSDETSGDSEEVSIPDLDALMNSLANDEVEDIESTAAKDEETGHSEESELPREELLSALTEDGFDDLGAEPSLEELASIPERSSDDSGDGDEDEEDSVGKKGRKKKEKKEKKEKKPGFFSKLFQALTDEDEEGAEGGELASLTDENQQVLNELAGDEAPKKEKKKKEKKEKKPKEKKPKKEKPPKEKKPPKPKKEKKPKPPKEPGAPEKAISPKKIAVSGIFAASLGILVCIPALVLPDRIASERATTAYTHREYTTAYKMLYGKEMTEDESIIYEQSRVLAWAQRYLDGYENYIAMNMEEEALDMLLMAMRNRDDLLEEAAKFNVEIQVNSVYDSIESLLSENYGLSYDEIVEINSIKKERDYTIRLMEIVGTLES